MKIKKHGLLNRVLAFTSALIIFVTPLNALSIVQANQGQFQTEFTIGDGLDLYQKTYWNESSINQMNYFEYSPNSNVVPIAAYGNKLYGRSTITEVTDYLKSNDYSILGGINGDFYTLATGLPCGIVVRNGELISSDGWQYGVGFKSDGTAFIGKPELKVTVNSPSGNIAITSVNKLRTNVGVYLLTDDFSSTTRISSAGTNVVLSTNNDTLTIGGEITATVESISTESVSTEIPKGKIILTADVAVESKLSGLNVGDTVTISTMSNDQRWNSADFAIGGGVLLIKDNTIIQQTDKSINPRSALGIKADGSVVLFTVDGRQGSYSIGMSLTELATELKELGCVDAINLDGGGSTTASICYPGDANITVINSPSDGTVRKNANFILFVAKEQGNDRLKHLYVRPQNQLALAGSTLNFSLFGTDVSYNPVNLTREPSITASSNLGDITENGTLQLSENATNGYIYASLGNIYGKTSITVLDNFDVMTVSSNGQAVQNLNFVYGQTSDLDIAVSYKGKQIHATDNIFTWELSSDLVGTIDENGLFTAGQNGTFGNLTISWKNGMSKVVPITVGKAPQIIENFEQSTNFDFQSNILYKEQLELKRLLDEQNSENTENDENIEQVYSVEDDVDPQSIVLQAPLSAISQQRNQEYVKYGYGSLKMAYDFSDVSASINENENMSEAHLFVKAINNLKVKNPKYLDIWVYGDSSGNSISLEGLNTSGQKCVSTDNYSIDFIGWQCLRFSFDCQVAQISGFGLTMNITHSSASSGVMYFDNLYATFDDTQQDITPPEIMLEYTIKQEANIDLYEQSAVLADTPTDPTIGDVLIISGSAADNTKTNILKNNVSATLDEKELMIGFNEQTGKFSLELDTSNLTSGIHKISVQAKDNYGNTSKNTIKFTVSSEDNSSSTFIDMNKHWSKSYVEYLSNNEIITGESTIDGYAFRPDRFASRVEMAVILSRYMNYDVDSYADVQLDFIDNKDIPKWAENYVKAVYSEGVMLGKQTASGVRFAPSQYVTRAEAMTLFGRTLEQGYIDNDLTFSDTKNIQSWAMPYVKKLYSLGVVGGYPSDNSIKPNNTITRAEIASILFKL